MLDYNKINIIFSLQQLKKLNLLENQIINFFNNQRNVHFANNFQFHSSDSDYGFFNIIIFSYLQSLFPSLDK